MTQPSSLVPVRFAAESARISEVAIHDAIAAGTLHAERIGGKLYVDLEGVLGMETGREDLTTESTEKHGRESESNRNFSV